MSKLSEPLKALINAAHAKPDTIPAPKNVKSVYERIASDASAKQVGLPAWLTASVRMTRHVEHNTFHADARPVDSSDHDPQLAGFIIRALQPRKLIKA